MSQPHWMHKYEEDIVDTAVILFVVVVLILMAAGIVQ